MIYHPSLLADCLCPTMFDLLSCVSFRAAGPETNSSDWTPLSVQRRCWGGSGRLQANRRDSPTGLLLGKHAHRVTPEKPQHPDGSRLVDRPNTCEQEMLLLAVKQTREHVGVKKICLIQSEQDSCRNIFWGRIKVNSYHEILNKWSHV